MIRVTGPSGLIIADKILKCDTFFKRAAGLMFKKSLKGHDGILLEPCSSIHSFFMYMNIDCFFLDKDRRILKILWNFGPRRISSIIKGSRYVLEIPAGKVTKDSVNEGEILEFSNI
ncbi:MAG TPA: DUF192 domain-containing protein [Candidatus Wallbacteria bacterium]|nr:DUF192 domain-containing protein [Candidatus Wallbacteria bacterium]